MSEGGVELATGYVSLVISGTEVSPGVKKALGAAEPEADKAGTRAGKRFSTGFGSSLKTGAAALGIGAIGATAIGFLKDSNAEAREAQKVGALTAQAIKSTGGAAKVTADHVGDLSTAISNKVGVDDEAIQSGANLLLTFKNVRNEVGKGNKIFDRATQAAVNLSAAGFGDLSGSSKQLGKALNDPIKGIAALGRAGVTFTQGQKDQIKTLVKSGKTLQAQKIILKEVESQVGGAAAAQATAGDKAAVAVGNLKEQIGTALLPVIDDLANFTSKRAVPAISEFVSGMQDGTGPGGDLADVIGDLVSVGKTAVEVVNGIPGPVKKFGVEALIAYVAISKLRGAVGGFKLAGFVAELTNTETRMAAVERGSFRLGSALRTAAGAGGAIALADGLQKSNKAVGTLETTLVGALTGFAVGGPIGAAVGGVAGLTAGLLSMEKATAAARKAAEVSLPPWKEYGSTLDGVSESTTEATRAMVYQRLEASGLLEATQALGLSDRQAVNAVMGKKAALEKMAAALRTNTTLSVSQRQALAQETTAINQARLAELRKNVALADTPAKVAAAKKALRDYQAQLGQKYELTVTANTGGAVTNINHVKSALEDVFALSKKSKTAGPGGIDVLLNLNTGGKPHRAGGGSVQAGQAYVVGERRPELFVPNSNGRIQNRVPAASMPISAAGQRIAMTMTNWHEGTGYFEVIADSRVDAYNADSGMVERAFG